MQMEIGLKKKHNKMSIVGLCWLKGSNGVYYEVFLARAVR